VAERLRLVPIFACRLPQPDERYCLMARPNVERHARGVLGAELDVPRKELPQPPFRVIHPFIIGRGPRVLLPPERKGGEAPSLSAALRETQQRRLGP